MSARTVVEHALTIYYDGDADLAGRVTANLCAEALREAAAVVGPRCEEYGVLGVDSLLRRMADEAATAAPTGDETTQTSNAPATGVANDFFQLGVTYTASHGWKFRVDSITTHPEDGERIALGWRHFNSQWEPYAYAEDDWDVHQGIDSIDTAEGGGGRDAGATTQPTELTIYCATYEHEPIPLGSYTNPGAARAHCEAHVRRGPTGDVLSLLDWWIEDDEDGIAELVATVAGRETVMGYVVTPLTVASAYDEEADK